MQIEAHVVDEVTTPEALLEELEQLRSQVQALQSIVAEQKALSKKLARLASFPEQNPNLVIEAEAIGKITYVNPVAHKYFPELAAAGLDHPLLEGISALVPIFHTQGLEYVSRELDLGHAVFEQKICYLEDGLLRIFAHDITARKRAEEAVKELAQQSRRLAHQVVRAQEEERRRLSRELHDEAGQALTALRISLELLQSELPSQNNHLRKSLEEAVTLTDMTRKQIRLTAQGLRPPALDTMGLNLTLEELCRNFAKRTLLQVDYEGQPLPTLPGEIDISLYRFVQEALTNVANHAAATRVKVKLNYNDISGICLIVSDNGRGFIPPPSEPVRWRANSGLGLASMQERLELLGGWLEIASTLGQGTSLTACIPVEELR